MTLIKALAFVSLLTIYAVSISCTDTSSSTNIDFTNENESRVLVTDNEQYQSVTHNSNFTITSRLCEDEQGPDCSKLRLGDDYHTTSAPQKGYLYSCNKKNPNAPGSIEAKITWIDFVENVWSFLKKPWLPEGNFTPETGIYAETVSNEERQININNLPVDGKIGDWPMTNYPTLNEIDRNPGIPGSNSSTFTYPVSPSKASSPTM